MEDYKTSQKKEASHKGKAVTDVVAHQVCNFSLPDTGEARAGRSQVPGHPGFQSATLSQKARAGIVVHDD